MRSEHSSTESNIKCGEINDTVVVIMPGDEKPTFYAKINKCASQL